MAFMSSITTSGREKNLNILSLCETRADPLFSKIGLISSGETLVALKNSTKEVEAFFLSSILLILLSLANPISKDLGVSLKSALSCRNNVRYSARRSEERGVG